MPEHARKANQLEAKIRDQQAVAVNLLSEIWSTFPELFSVSSQTEVALQNTFDEENDFGLEQKLTELRLSLTKSKSKLLGDNVLSLFKKVAKRSKVAT